MLIHVATLYSVRAAATASFIQSIRAGGNWHLIARRVTPDLVASDLLQDQYSPSPVFLCLDFWASKEKYLCARESPAYGPLFRLRHDMAVATVELGVFAFPARTESETVFSHPLDLCR